MSSQTHILVFADPAYPQFCTEAQLSRLVPGSFTLVKAEELSSKLEEGCDLLLSFHGAYFPKASWNALFAFLERGGNLAVFGGMPFTRPVTADNQIEPEQDSYTRQIFLGPFFPVSTAGQTLTLISSPEAVLLRDLPLSLENQAPGTFWSFNPKSTQVSDHPDELGSAGPLDTLIQPLVYALGTNEQGQQHHVATPVCLLDQRSGRFKGGRWLLSPWLPASIEDWLRNAEAIQCLLSLVAQGKTEVEVRPTLGCYQPGEVPSLNVYVRTRSELQVRVTIYPPEQQLPLRTLHLVFSAASVQQVQSSRLPAAQRPGLYRVRVEYQPEDGQALAQESGFWIWDEDLVTSTLGKRLSAQREYFFQGEELFLVNGTTYMDSLVQRKFLALPNPARWDRDFAQMKAAGINLIRTGIWTAWREMLPLPGMVDESYLRALDAFVLTACKHDLQVIFTFFSFSPLLFEGENPWLDPRALEAQKDYVALLAARYAQVELLSWDLINEPSFGDPKRIFSQRPLPSHDRFEVAAFQEWLRQRFTLSELQLRWRKTPLDLPTWDQVRPPSESDYDTYVRNTEVRAFLQVADYTRFSQDMFTRWAAQMVEAIRLSGNRMLVGVGQDESASRISPQFYAPAVDYTTTHPWWNVDDMLWDMLLDKTPDTPNLIQETGIMQLRDIDGLPWRDAQGAANMLERKLITGLSARGAGLIQWLWHTNNYMTSDNENAIGLVRADGSAKPELLVMEEFGSLVSALKGRLIESSATSDVWVVIPYSQWFVRPDLGRLATQQAVRVLGHDLDIVPQLISEYQLQTLEQHQPRVVILPSIRLLDQQAWQYLRTYANSGGTLLVTGLLSRDAHDLAFDPEIEGLVYEETSVPIARYEILQDLQGNQLQVTFGDEKMSYVRKAHNRVESVAIGQGRLIWCGLPLELASDASALRHLYAGVLDRPEVPQSSSPLLVVRKALHDGILILLVSETSSSRTLTLEEGVKVTLAGERAGAIILNQDGTTQLFGGVCLEA